MILLDEQIKIDTIASLEKAFIQLIGETSVFIKEKEIKEALNYAINHYKVLGVMTVKE